MKILVDTFVLSSATTGIRSYTIELCEGLKELSGKERKYIFPGYRFFRNNPIFASRNHAVSKLLYHVVFFAWKQIVLPVTLLFTRSKAVLCVDYILPVCPGWKKFVVYHDAFFWEHKSHYNEKWRRYFTWLASYSVDRKTVIIATSQYTRGKLQQLVFSKEKNIQVVYQSPRAAHFNRSVNEPADVDKYFLHVGYYDKRKNLPLLIKAYAIYLKEVQGSPARLVLAGGKAPAPDMDDWEEVTAIMEKLGLQNQVKRLGFVSAEDLAGLYQNAYAFIFPSYDEGFGIPIIEAMKYGLPVVISDQGASREVMGENGLIFPYDDPTALAACLVSLEDGEHHARLQAKSKTRSKAFSREKFASDMDHIITKYHA